MDLKREVEASLEKGKIFELQKKQLPLPPNTRGACRHCHKQAAG